MGKNTTKDNDIVQAVNAILKTYGYVSFLWHVDDVHFICEQHGYSRLSDEEAFEVFQVANEQFDGENGISWPALEKALVAYLEREGLTNPVCQPVA